LALRGVGVDYGQGWYFARPSTVDQLLDRYPVDDEANIVPQSVQ